MGRLPARIVATRSVLFPGTEDMMGFGLVDPGLKIFLGPRAPRFPRSELPRQIAPFREENGLRLKDATHFCSTPAGQKSFRGWKKISPCLPPNRDWVGKFREIKEISPRHRDCFRCTILNGRKRPGPGISAS